MDPDGRVCGAVVGGPDGLLRTIKGDNVVLACGGFEGNREMLTAYVGADAVSLPTIAPGVNYNKASGAARLTFPNREADYGRCAQGLGIRAAMEVGAGIAVLGMASTLSLSTADPRSPTQ
jgi:hypothetical protein